MLARFTTTVFVAWLAAAAAIADDVGLTETERRIAPQLNVSDILAKTVWPKDADLMPLAHQSISNFAKAIYDCEQTEVLSIGDLRLALLDGRVERAIDRGKAVNGWTAFVQARICGDELPIKFMVYQLPGGKYRTSSMLAGNSHAWLGLMMDVQRSVNGAVAIERMRVDADCGGDSAYRIVRADVEEDSGLQEQIFGIRFGGNWREAWTVHSCGVEIILDATFRADGRGGAYFDFKARKDSTHSLE